MSTLGTEQGEILASFAEEIRPLLADVVAALRRRAEQPGDDQAASRGLSGLQTLQSVVGFLELLNLQALLGVAGEGLQALASASHLEDGQRDAGWGLAGLLSLQDTAIVDGD